MSRARRLTAELAADIERLRDDAGLSQRRVARAAGISNSTLSAIERGLARPSQEVICRIASALGAELGIRLYPGTGPVIRDHLQAAIIETLIGVLHVSWHAAPEVRLLRPARGSIDLVLERAEPPLVACEAHSQLRRLEQQIRWATTKAEGLAEQRGLPASRLLALRSTLATRTTASEFAALLAAAYPARHADLIAALVDGGPWPGPGIVWFRIAEGRATLMEHPPRGIRLGR